MSVPLPKFLKDFYALFPLYTYPESLSIHSPCLSEEDEDTVHIAPNPTLCIVQPTRPEFSVLSADVHCLKWQAYLALRRIPGGIRVRWDLSPDGAHGGSLPNLYLPPPTTSRGGQGLRGELLEAKRIPSWVDGEIEKGSPGVLEGFKDEETRDESRAWVSLLEGDVHAALLLTTRPPSLFRQLMMLDAPINTNFNFQLSTSLTGLSSLIPPFGTRIPRKLVIEKYREAITALSFRLGQDKWFLGSGEPTTLDALAFAYLYTALEESHDVEIKREVQKRVNLVAWEKKVRSIVQSTMRRH